ERSAPRRLRFKTTPPCSSLMHIVHALPRLQGPPLRLLPQPAQHAGSRPGTNGSKAPPTELIGSAQPDATGHLISASLLTTRSNWKARLWGLRSTSEMRSNVMGRSATSPNELSIIFEQA